jgi:hypothetical protein
MEARREEIFLVHSFTNASFTFLAIHSSHYWSLVINNPMYEWEKQHLGGPSTYLQIRRLWHFCVPYDVFTNTIICDALILLCILPIYDPTYCLYITVDIDFMLPYIVLYIIDIPPHIYIYIYIFFFFSYMWIWYLYILYICIISIHVSESTYIFISICEDNVPCIPIGWHLHHDQYSTPNF